ncbi:MAG TPA: glycosyltransferase family 4 protein [Acidimicrobiales bacterium]|jgi:phosphatidylinositol alpha-mannosyltransferase|nr:glycosyltransferase family 4 protein [Acidimicrobiales bacterium]
MKIAMLSPYSLSRPGGVQGQVFGLSRALRKLGHHVTVLGPDDEVVKDFGSHGGGEGAEGFEPDDVFVVGSPTGVRSNGSVAPVSISFRAAARAERYVRHGEFDVLHIHEPLAPVTPYGFILSAPLPMVGTYHRAGVSRWVPILKPLAKLVGFRLQIRVAVSEAARETGLLSGGGDFEVLFNGVDMERFATAEPVPSDVPIILFLGRHENRKGLSVLLDAFAHVDRPAMLWVAGDGPENEVQHRRHPESDRVKWLGMLTDDEVASRLAGADILCAPSLRGESFGMVVLEGMAARCAVVASDLEGYRMAAGGHATLFPPGDIPALSRALGVALADAAEGSGQSSPEALKAAEAHAQGWSMDSLAERYVEVYQRAIARYDADEHRMKAKAKAEAKLETAALKLNAGVKKRAKMDTKVKAKTKVIDKPKREKRLRPSL